MLVRKARAATLHAALLAVLAVPQLVAQPAAASAKPEDLCSIEGRVLNEATGAPVGRATVVIAPPRTNQAAPPGYSVTTDAEGRFVFASLQPAAYRLMALRDGFMITDYGVDDRRNVPANSGSYPQPQGPPLNLAPGQKRSDIEFKLRPFGAISGRVLGADGEPLAGVNVSVMTPGYVMGIRRLTGVSTVLALTDDRGEYRLFQIPPGRYYVAVQTSPVDEGEDRSATPRQEGYASTYFPGTADAAGAAPIVVAPGGVTQGLNIKLAKMRLSRISGRVIVQPGAAGPATQVSLESPASSMSNRTAVVGPQGQFEFRGVMPGSYMLTVAGPRGFADTRGIEVGTDPIENLEVPLSAGIEIQGSLRAERGENLDLRRTRVTLTRRVFPLSLLPVVPDDGGNFTLSHAIPGLYDPSISPIPDGYYLKSATWGDRDILEDGLDPAGGAGGSLQLVLATGAAKVGGAVTDDKGAPVPGATVVLAPQEPGRRVRPRLYLSATADRTGRFNIANIPPGEYKLYAWQEVLNGAWMSAEFMQPLEAKGVAQSVKEGGAYSVDLKALPRQE